jgi:hypothetical protein
MLVLAEPPMAAHPVAQPFRYGGGGGLVELRNQLIREILFSFLFQPTRKPVLYSAPRVTI